MASKSTDGFTCLGAIMALPVIYITSCLLSGWVGSSLWKWFIVPVFHVSPLLWWQAVGMSITVGFFTYQEPPHIEDDREAWVKIFAMLVRYPIVYIFALLFHALWH